MVWMQYSSRASQSRIYAQESDENEKVVVDVAGVERPIPFHVHYGDASIARPRAFLDYDPSQCSSRVLAVLLDGDT